MTRQGGGRGARKILFCLRQERRPGAGSEPLAEPRIEAYLPSR